MSTSDSEATIVTGFSSGEGAPAQESEHGPETASTCQDTAVSTMDGESSTNGDPDDEQVDLKANHEKLLTNTKTFFPELVWRHVVGKLGTQADIDNCSSSSPFFADLLREKRERKVVLPTVFGILAKRYCDGENKDEAYKETNVESIPWQRRVQRKLPHWMTGLWKCRLVCNKWNAAIEDIHRNGDAGHYRMLWDFKEAENEGLGSKCGTDWFSTESNVVKFLDHFEATHYSGGGGGRVSKKCPFLGRAVVIRFGFGRQLVESKQTCMNKLLELLEKFGDQVFYLGFEWSHRHDSVECENHLKLKEIVELMPNLKVLRIFIADFPHKKLLALEEEILRNPFPKMTNLEMISAIEIPGVLCNHLVNQNRQLIRLQIRAIDFNGNCSIFTEKLPNLRQLSLLMMESLDIFEAFERYPATLDLEKLHLLFTNFGPFVPLSRVLNAIGSKLNSDSCTELVLQMPGATSDAQRLSVFKDSLLSRLKLGKIERCQFTSYSYDHFSLDFLLNSKNTLREIRIDRPCNPSYESGELEELKDKQVIKFLGCEDKMEESNIGQEMPRLRKLKVSNRHYTIKPSGVVKFEFEEEQGFD